MNIIILRTAVVRTLTITLFPTASQPLCSYPSTLIITSISMSLTLLSKRAPARCLRASGGVGGGGGGVAAAVATAVGGTRAFSTPVNDSFAPISTTPPSAPEAQGAVWRAVNARAPRHDWTKDEIRELYNTPLMELAHQAVGLFCSRCDGGMTWHGNSMASAMWEEGTG